MSRREELLDSLVADLAPVKPAPDVRLLACLWLLCSALCVVAVTHLVGPIRPTALAQLQDSPRFLAEMLVGGLAAAGLALATFRAAVPGGAGRVLVACASLPGALWVGGLLVGLVHPALEPSMLGKRDLCFLESFVYALPPLVVALYWQLRLFPLRPGHSAVLAGLAAGALPALYMQIACMYVPAHILLFHVGPGVAVGLAAPLFLRLLSRIIPGRD